MSAKDKRIERGQRFRRFRRGENRRGVSPVVATLILILIAVAAAAALYLWLVVWQGSVTSGIGSPGAQYTVTIGGSTSAYPFDSFAVTQFEQNNSDVAISNNQGGTGAGMLAMCAGQVDIGVASTPETLSTLQAPIASQGFACPLTPVPTETTVAYDAVDVVVQGANTHGLLSMNYDTLNVIYSQASTATPNLAASTFTIDGATIVPTLPAQGTGIAWDQIPAAVQGAVIGTTFVGASPEAANAGIGAGAACTGAGYTNDICSTAAGTTPCGWTVCAGTFASEGAGPTFANAAIVPVERSDASGTTQTFEAKLLGYTKSTAIATTFAGLGYSGCGSNNYLSDCGIILPATSQLVGNPGVLASVAASANEIGYASDGLARTTTGIGAAGIIPFAGVGQVSATGVPQSGSGFVQTTGANQAYNGIVPTTGGSGTIAGGVLASATVNNYVGWRPFQYWTLGAPTGEVQRFINFVVDPANNQAFATQSAEVSIYSI